MIPKKEITKNQAVKELWRKGVLHWKLNSAQREMYDLYKTSEKRVITWLCSRRFGKSHSLAVTAIELCLAQPNTIVKYLCPTQKMIKTILHPIIRQITEDCPKEVKPTFMRNEGIYKFPNGSEIQLAGNDNGRAENLRGGLAHLCIVDEAGFCDDLAYTVRSILLPTVSTTGGKIILSSTPPRSPGHDFAQFVKDASFEGSLIKKTIFDNVRFSPAQVDEIMSQYRGGMQDNEFRREYLAEMITDVNSSVIPEFSAEVEMDCIKELERPGHCDYYVAADIGFVDFTVVLFGYLDFRKSRLVIEDELVMSKDLTPNFNTEVLAKAIIAKENSLLMNTSFGEKKEPYLRVSDTNLFFINDMHRLHGVLFMPTQKDDLEAAVNNVRVLVGGKKIVINPRCKYLISHLKGATWKVGNKRIFDKSPDGGHYDALAALIYMCRNVQWNKNPFPANYDNRDNPNWYVHREQDNALFSQIKNIFKPKKSL